MPAQLSIERLESLGAPAEAADRIHVILAECDEPIDAWTRLRAEVLSPAIPFAVHLAAYDAAFFDWDESLGPRPAWRPTTESSLETNVGMLAAQLHIAPSDVHRWSVEHRDDFWQNMIATLAIQFKRPPTKLRGSDDVEFPNWLAGATLNIADSCFAGAGDSPAIVYQREGGILQSITLAELDRLTNRVANGLTEIGLKPDDRVAIAMPMTVEAVAGYLGVLKAGCVAVSIADSFASEEIATRVRIANAKLMITQDVNPRAGKVLPMYQRVVDSGGIQSVVCSAGDSLAVTLRNDDLSWDEFLSDDDQFETVSRNPKDPCNILFSSGTTGEPKAIPWTQVTPIKCASDGYLHHDIKSGDVVAWPTNLGWMMGPWLIFAALMNRGTIALYYGAPNSAEFCRFVEQARINMLGLVPSLVKAWRAHDMAAGVDWSDIKLFSSTGEASNAEDYLYLMSLANYRPVIEYCGGTEIGGGYVSGSLAHDASPATFATPCFGLDFLLLNEEGRPAPQGEMFIVPPSVGLSETLLNRDHHEVYFAGTPKGPNGEVLRRHGDQMEQAGAGFYRALGRADDTMNLGGIKISSAEIERVANTTSGVRETAAIAVPSPGGGPSLLVIYAVGDGLVANTLKATMQKAISADLNPLFRIHDVVVIDTLPRTASNKVMRRVLRAQYTG